MNAQRRKIAIIVLAVLTQGAGYVFADVAATVDPAYPGFSALITSINPAWSTNNGSCGWRFFVDKQITITHLGIYDDSDNGLASSHILGIWRVKKTGGLQLERQVSIGPGGVTENHHVYVALGEPFTIVPDPVPYVLNGVEYYERWLVGVWSPAGNQDGLILYPREAATLNIEQADIIRLQNYTYKTSPIFTYPWGDTDDYNYFGVNFKYTVPGAPTANAGPDVQIYTSQQALTVLHGSGADPSPGPSALTYQWLENGVVLQGWTAIGEQGEADLNLASLDPALSIGVHTLMLQVTDGETTTSDTMILTVANTPPDAQPAPTLQVLEIGRDVILITGELADFDGDELTYQWIEDGQTLGSGTITPPAGGAKIGIEDLVILAGDPRFPLGQSQVQLVVSDGTNPPVSASVIVEMTDTMAPSLAPTPSTAMLWPANHAMVPVTIWANASDKSGGMIFLTASVQSSEPLDAAGDGSTEEDFTVTSIDNEHGTVLVQLRAERSGTGDGRVYTVTITATDGSGNQSTAKVDIRVPHDKKKK